MKLVGGNPVGGNPVGEIRRGTPPDESHRGNPSGETRRRKLRKLDHSSEESRWGNPARFVSDMFVKS